MSVISSGACLERCEGHQLIRLVCWLAAKSQQAGHCLRAAAVGTVSCTRYALRPSQRALHGQPCSKQV